MKPESRILLVEVVVIPSGKEESSVAERYMRCVVTAKLSMAENDYKAQGSSDNHP